MSHIRRAVAADSNEVFALATAFATTFPHDRNTFDSSFARLIAHEDVLFLVSEQSQFLLGYLLGFDHDSLFANGRVGWIEELMAREDRRRNGTGRQLVEHFEQWARSRNVRLISLATRRADLFYRAIGYEQSAVYFRKLL